MHVYVFYKSPRTIHYGFENTEMIVSVTFALIDWLGMLTMYMSLVRRVSGQQVKWAENPISS